MYDLPPATIINLSGIIATLLLMAIIFLDRSSIFLWLAPIAIKLKLISLLFCLAVVLAILTIVSGFSLFLHGSYMVVLGGILFLAYVIIEVLILEWRYGVLPVLSRLSQPFSSL
jgi:hypothetical protein